MSRTLSPTGNGFHFLVAGLLIMSFSGGITGCQKAEKSDAQKAGAAQTTGKTADPAVAPPAAAPPGPMSPE